MITLGKILEINISSDGIKNNSFIIEIPTFETALKNGNQTLFTVTASAAVNPGTFDPYQINDLVYISFIDNDYSDVVILGKVYQGNESVKDNNNARGFQNIQGLQVIDYVNLPKNITIGDLNYTNLCEILVLKEEINNLKAELESLKTKVDSM